MSKLIGLSGYDPASTPEGVPNPFVPAVVPYPSVYKGPDYTRPMWTPWVNVRNPAMVWGGAVNGLGATDVIAAGTAYLKRYGFTVNGLSASGPQRQAAIVAAFDAAARQNGVTDLERRRALDRLLVAGAATNHTRNEQAIKAYDDDLGNPLTRSATSMHRTLGSGRVTPEHLERVAYLHETAAGCGVPDDVITRSLEASVDTDADAAVEAFEAAMKCACIAGRDPYHPYDAKRDAMVRGGVAGTLGGAVGYYLGGWVGAAVGLLAGAGAGAYSAQFKADVLDSSGCPVTRVF